VRVAWSAAPALFLLLDSNPAATGPGGFWEKVADPDGEVVEGLVARARVELDRGVPGGSSRESAGRAEALLGEALERKPRHFAASFLRGDALALLGRQAEGIAALHRACNLAESPEDESTCTLRLAVEEARAGRYQDALYTYDRHLRAGAAQATAYTNSAEILMALGRLGEAAGRYREAIRLEEAAPATRQRDQSLALALYGLAVALDRDDQPSAAREAMGRATTLDPRLRLLDPDGGGGDVFFVPAGDLHYYRGLALRVLGRSQEAAEAWGRFLKEAPASPWVERARAHLRTITSGAADGDRAQTPDAGSADAPPGGRGPWRVVAAATVESEGPIGAPLLDAALKGPRRLLEPCFEDLPALIGSTVRLRLELAIDGRGVLRRVVTETPAGWSELPACLEERLKRGLRLPRPSKAAPTRAHYEMVLSAGKPR
jgi:tetratricopeptide (TPR) repeat protein